MYKADEPTNSQAAGLRPSTFWPGKLLGRRPGLKEINLVCWGLFVAFLLVPLVLICWIHARHGTGFIRQLHSDFVYFYGVGQIAREYPASRLYDYGLQQQVFTAIYPAHAGVYGPSPYPPFVALFFSLFTHLSFEAAYVLWLVISLALYLAGIAVVAKEVFFRERLKISLALCLALAFYPFFFATMINAQLSAIAVCALGFAVYQERHGNPFRSGLLLALLSYKPTLLLLILPMLLLTRRLKTILGFMTGAAVLMFTATAIFGMKIWPAYAHFLVYFGSAAGLSGAARLQLWKYLDLSSFFGALLGGRVGIGRVILILVMVASAAWLAMELWKSRRGGRAAQSLAWAATLTWTLLLNVYVPIYDGLLVVPAIILTLGALRELRWSTAVEWTTLLAVVIFAVSWKTESFAQNHGIQLLTVMFVVLGVWQLLLLRRAISAGSAEAISPRAV